VSASGCGTGKNKLVESFAYGILQIELRHFNLQPVRIST
jgi:hypothetical protein